MTRIECRTCRLQAHADGPGTAIHCLTCYRLMRERAETAEERARQLEAENRVLRATCFAEVRACLDRLSRSEPADAPRDARGERADVVLWLIWNADNLTGDRSEVMRSIASFVTNGEHVIVAKRLRDMAKDGASEAYAVTQKRPRKRAVRHGDAHHAQNPRGRTDER